MTNLEKIQNFDVDEMAEFIVTIIEATETKFLKTLNEQGIEASMVKISTELQLQIHRDYLMQEVTENE